MNADARTETTLTEAECDLLRDWWDEDETAGVESSFPIIDRIITSNVEQERAAWAARVEALVNDYETDAAQEPHAGELWSTTAYAIRGNLLTSDSTAALDAVKAEAGRAALRDAVETLRMAERVCALVGWTATGRSDRDRALTQAWMEWAATRPGMSERDAWPDLDDAGIEALARKRDGIRAATLARFGSADLGGTQ